MAFSKIAAENLGGSALPAISGASLTNVDIGNYSVHAIAEYGETTQYDFTSSAHPVIISNESCSLTATSTSDIFIATVSCSAFTNVAGNGFGLMLVKDTASDFSNADGDTTGDYWLHQTGRKTEMAESTSFYANLSFTCKFTLPNTTQTYFRLHGMVERPSSGTVTFNVDSHATTEFTRHGVQIVQYRYNG
jgi:hypothetical protein